MCLTEVSYSINIMYKIYVSLKVFSSSTTLYVHVEDIEESRTSYGQDAGIRTNSLDPTLNQDNLFDTKID